MPLYDGACLDCDCEFEYVHAMKDSGRVPRCPECKSRNTEKIIVALPIVRASDIGWEHESGGKGRRIAQLAKHAKDETCYFRSRDEAKEAAKKRGFTVLDE